MISSRAIKRGSPPFPFFLAALRISVRNTILDQSKVKRLVFEPPDFVNGQFFGKA